MPPGRSRAATAPHRCPQRLCRLEDRKRYRFRGRDRAPTGQPSRLSGAVVPLSGRALLRMDQSQPAACQRLRGHDHLCHRISLCRRTQNTANANLITPAQTTPENTRAHSRLIASVCADGARTAASSSSTIGHASSPGRVSVPPGHRSVVNPCDAVGTRPVDQWCDDAMRCWAVAIFVTAIPLHCRLMPGRGLMRQRTYSRGQLGQMSVANRVMFCLNNARRDERDQRTGWVRQPCPIAAAMRRTAGA